MPPKRDDAKRRSTVFPPSSKQSIRKERTGGGTGGGGGAAGASPALSSHHASSPNLSSALLPPHSRRASSHVVIKPPEETEPAPPSPTRAAAAAAASAASAAADGPGRRRSAGVVTFNEAALEVAEPPAVGIMVDEREARRVLERAAAHWDSTISFVRDAVDKSGAGALVRQVCWCALGFGRPLERDEMSLQQWLRFAQAARLDGFLTETTIEEVYEACSASEDLGGSTDDGFSMLSSSAAARGFLDFEGFSVALYTIAALRHAAHHRSSMLPHQTLQMFSDTHLMPYKNDATQDATRIRPVVSESQPFGELYWRYREPLAELFDAHKEQTRAPAATSPQSPPPPPCAVDPLSPVSPASRFPTSPRPCGPTGAAQLRAQSVEQHVTAKGFETILAQWDLYPHALSKTETARIFNETLRCFEPGIMRHAAGVESPRQLYHALAIVAAETVSAAEHPNRLTHVSRVDFFLQAHLDPRDGGGGGGLQPRSVPVSGPLPSPVATALYPPSIPHTGGSALLGGADLNALRLGLYVAVESDGETPLPLLPPPGILTVPDTNRVDPGETVTGIAHSTLEGGCWGANMGMRVDFPPVPSDPEWEAQFTGMRVEAGWVSRAGSGAGGGADQVQEDAGAPSLIKITVVRLLPIRLYVYNSAEEALFEERKRARREASPFQAKQGIQSEYAHVHLQRIVSRELGGLLLQLYKATTGGDSKHMTRDMFTELLGRYGIPRCDGVPFASSADHKGHLKELSFVSAICHTAYISRESDLFDVVDVLNDWFAPGQARKVYTEAVKLYRQGLSYQREKLQILSAAAALEGSQTQQDPAAAADQPPGAEGGGGGGVKKHPVVSIALPERGQSPPDSPSALSPRIPFTTNNSLSQLLLRKLQRASVVLTELADSEGEEDGEGGAPDGPPPAMLSLPTLSPAAGRRRSTMRGRSADQGLQELSALLGSLTDEVTNLQDADGSQAELLRVTAERKQLTEALQLKSTDQRRERQHAAAQAGAAKKASANLRAELSQKLALIDAQRATMRETVRALSEVRQWCDMFFSQMVQERGAGQGTAGNNSPTGGGARAAGIAKEYHTGVEKLLDVASTRLRKQIASKNGDGGGDGDEDVGEDVLSHRWMSTYADIRRSVVACAAGIMAATTPAGGALGEEDGAGGCSPNDGSAARQELALQDLQRSLSQMSEMLPGGDEILQADAALLSRVQVLETALQTQTREHRDQVEVSAKLADDLAAMEESSARQRRRYDHFIRKSLAGPSAEDGAEGAELVEDLREEVRMLGRQAATAEERLDYVEGEHENALRDLSASVVARKQLEDKLRTAQHLLAVQQQPKGEAAAAASSPPPLGAEANRRSHRSLRRGLSRKQSSKRGGGMFSSGDDTRGMRATGLGSRRPSPHSSARVLPGRSLRARGGRREQRGGAGAASPEEPRSIGVELSTTGLAQVRLEEVETEGVTVTVVDAESEAYQQGIREGMVVQEIAGEPVRRVSDVKRLCPQGLEAGESMEVSVILRSEVVNAEKDGVDLYQTDSDVSLTPPPSCLRDDGYGATLAVSAPASPSGSQDELPSGSLSFRLRPLQMTAVAGVAALRVTLADLRSLVSGLVSEARVGFAAAASAAQAAAAAAADAPQELSPVAVAVAVEELLMEDDRVCERHDDVEEHDLDLRGSKMHSVSRGIVARVARVVEEIVAQDEHLRSARARGLARLVYHRVRRRRLQRVPGNAEGMYLACCITTAEHGRSLLLDQRRDCRERLRALVAAQARTVSSVVPRKKSVQFVRGSSDAFREEASSSSIGELPSGLLSRVTALKDWVSPATHRRSTLAHETTIGGLRAQVLHLSSLLYTAQQQQRRAPSPAASPTHSEGRASALGWLSLDVKDTIREASAERLAVPDPDLQCSAALLAAVGVSLSELGKGGTLSGLPCVSPLYEGPDCMQLVKMLHAERARAHQRATSKPKLVKRRIVITDADAAATVVVSVNGAAPPPPPPPILHCPVPPPPPPAADRRGFEPSSPAAAAHLRDTFELRRDTKREDAGGGGEKPKQRQQQQQQRPATATGLLNQLVGRPAPQLPRPAFSAPRRRPDTVVATRSEPPPSCSTLAAAAGGYGGSSHESFLRLRAAAPPVAATSTEGRTASVTRTIRAQLQRNAATKEKAAAASTQGYSQIALRSLF